ncbi:MAG: sigma-70 family RNA polymerase sigma factor [Faecalibacterium sp.]
MLFTLLQFFAGNILYLALHLETSRFPQPLSPKKEADAFAALRQGDPAAWESLVQHNLRLVAHVCKKYYASPADQEDLISIGTIGLMKAVKTFDATRHARFSTYASKCIENEIRMQFRRGRKAPSTISLQDSIETGKSDSALTVSDLIKDDTCMEEDTEQAEDAKRLHAFVDTLGGRERQVVLLRYGLSGHPPLTQHEVADLLGISRSYVSRIEKKALAFLRKCLEN